MLEQELKLGDLVRIQDLADIGVFVGTKGTWIRVLFMGAVVLEQPQVIKVVES